MDFHPGAFSGVESNEGNLTSYGFRLIPLRVPRSGTRNGIRTVVFPNRSAGNIGNVMDDISGILIRGQI